MPAVIDRERMQQDALGRAIGNQSTMNYGAIFQGFMEKGIPESEHSPAGECIHLPRLAGARTPSPPRRARGQSDHVDSHRTERARRNDRRREGKGRPHLPYGRCLPRFPNRPDCQVTRWGLRKCTPQAPVTPLFHGCFNHS